jgi:hypothetical protein
MADRHSGYIITLSGSVREDDSEAILNAIRMIKGVAAVQPIVDDITGMMARAQVRSEVRDKLYVAVSEALK